MAYAGRQPTTGFRSTPTKDSFNGDNSTVAFTLSIPTRTNDVEVFVENVQQEPVTAYSISGTTLTFTSAPPTGTGNIYVIHRAELVSNGVHTPSADLTAANATITGDLTVTGTTITIDSATAQTVDLGDNDKIRLGDSDDAQLYHDGSDLIINNDTGDIAITGANVGINTSSPSTNLDFGVTSNNSWIVTTRKNGNSVNAIGVNSDYGMRFGAPSDIASGNALISFGSISASDGSTFSEKMRLDASGNVTLNAGGTYRLDINAPTSSSAKITCDNTPMEIGTFDSHQLEFLTANTERMRIDSLGHVTIGRTSRDNATTDNGHNLYASGEHYLYTSTTNTNNDVIRVHNYLGNVTFSVDADGDVQNTNNSYTAISDQSIKENIVDANSQWDDIKALQIRNYNLIDYPNVTHLGVVAQEVEAAGMNGLIKENEDGLKSVKYSILYMKAVKALQEAIGRIETLEAEVATLKEAN